MRRAKRSGPAGRGLTPRQSKIIQAMADSARRSGHGLTYREIGKEVGLASVSGVSYQLSRLEEKGYVSREAGLARSAVVLIGDDPLTGPQGGRAPRDSGGDQRVTQVPLVGRIAAGDPILADQSVAGVIPLPTQLIGQGEFIMLTVTGDSMIDAAIADGDWVVVRRETDVENGDIVAASIESDTSADQEATIKTFKKSGGHVWLIPHNPAYEPRLGDGAEIIGKVVAVLRRV